jgi:hypothetical protein
VTTSDRAASSEGDGRSERWSRQLSLRETTIWYSVALATYVVSALLHKALLNWFVGPVWLVLVVVLGPALADRIRGKT